MKRETFNRILFIALFLVVVIGITIFIFLFKNDSNIDDSNVVEDTSINLSDYTKDVTIKKGGTYVITGSLDNALVVKASNDDEVTLILDNVNIKNDDDAGIVGISGKSLTIKSKKDSINVVSDGGESSYDAAIYSDIPLTLEGEGTIRVSGNQKDGEGIATKNKDITINSGIIEVKSEDDGINVGGEDGAITINGGTIYVNANGDGIDSNGSIVFNGGRSFIMGSDKGGNSAIDTDKGYTINGGVVIACGSDMVEAPVDGSNQYSLVLSMHNISNNKMVSLVGESFNLTFTSEKAFSTLIISTPQLSEGVYKLYVDGSYSGNLVEGIYERGTYTPGELLGTYTIDNTVTIFNDR